MELVPIIYTALVIFAVLAIVTILISYIMYKIKVKNGIDEDVTESSILKSKPEFMQNSIKADNGPHKHEPKSSRERKEKKEREHSGRKPKHSRKESKPKQKPIKENKRIQVLKQLQPNLTNPAATKEDTQNIKTTPSSGVHVKKYSEDDSEFFRLDTSRKKKK